MAVVLNKTFCCRSAFAESLPRESVNAWLDQACDQAVQTLEQASAALDSGVAPALAAAADAEARCSWSGWAPLQRRTGQLLSDARQVALQAAAIARALQRTP